LHVKQRLGEEQDSLEELINRLLLPPETRSEADLRALLAWIEPIDFFQRRCNAQHRRALCRCARYEKHQEAFPLYEVGDLADKAWVVLGCTPSLEDYKGSVDVITESGKIGKVNDAITLFH
jgi:hypothetical protein